MCVYLRMYVCMYVCMYNKFMYVFMYVCMYVCYCRLYIILLANNKYFHENKEMLYTFMVHASTCVCARSHVCLRCAYQ